MEREEKSTALEIYTILVDRYINTMLLLGKKPSTLPEFVDSKTAEVLNKTKKVLLHIYSNVT